MPDYAKIFTYEVEGLSYTVSLYEEDGKILADITLTEGSMDVNALYYGDDEFSGTSESLSGPLNLNGTSLEGEKIQWDDAVALSDPGLGSEGDEKETYLHEGDTLTVELGAESLDEVDIFGIRATSTTTEDGSIKAVSDDPEEPVDPVEPTYEKVFFGWEFSETGEPLSGTWILDQEPDPNPYGVTALPEGTEPTFENYLSYYASDTVWGDVDLLEGVAFYETDENGTLQEVFRFDAPEAGFQSTEEVLDAYYAALDAYEAESGTDGADLLAALSIDMDPEAEATAEEFSEADDYEFV